MSANAGDVLAIVAVFLTFGLVISTWETGAPDEFNRLQTKNKELRNRASREYCNVPTSTSPRKAVGEIFNPPSGPELVDEDSP